MPVPARLPLWLHRWWPAALPADGRERWRVVLGAALGLGLTALLCQALGLSPWVVAPLGASTVLVFGVPASPLAQPWAVVAGNSLSALVGVGCSLLLGPTPGAAALAVALAIGLMFTLRCLHPPGGAVALLVVLGGITHPSYALVPVALNSVLLVLAAIAYNHATGRPYPPRPAAATPRDDEALALEADLDRVLARHNQVLDIGRDELLALVQDTRLRTVQRHLAQTRCADIMSSPPISAAPAMPHAEAQALLQAHGIKALPVVDAAGGIVGIVTRADLLRPAAPDAQVRHCMSRRVRVVSAQRHLAALLPLFASTGHHHIPVVDGADRLVGMITQSDVVGALAQGATEARDGT